MRALLAVAVSVATSVLVSACLPGGTCLIGGLCKDDDGASSSSDADAAASASAPPAPMCTAGGRPHVGLGGQDVAATADGLAGGDRARVKPFSALVTEYARVLGAENAPSLSGAAPTFGIAADRWFLEPIASAVFVNKAFEVAFDGCSRLVARDPELAAPPTEGSARATCETFARRFWSHDATPEQLDACVAAALEATERPWSYACASVLTATPFLTY